MAVPGVAAAIVSSLPYLIEGVALLTNYIQTLTSDDIDPDDIEAMEELVAKYQDSAARADAALDSLAAAIAAKRAQG